MYKKNTVHFKWVNFMVCKLYKTHTHNPDKLKPSVTYSWVLSEKLRKSPFVGTKM